MRYTYFLLFVCLIVSCGEQAAPGTESSDTTARDSASAGILVPETTCYENITGRDTVRMRVEIFPNVVNGSITYNYFEKDKNEGIFEGRLNGDTLIANYTFSSEGMQSHRQVAFLLRDSVALEGFGPVEEQAGKMVFTNLQKLKFEGRPMRKVACNEN